MKNALIVWGGWDGHQPEEVAGILGGLLREENYTVQISDTLDSFADAEKLASVDLVVPVWTMGTIAKEQLEPLLKAVREGGCDGIFADALAQVTAAGKRKRLGDEKYTALNDGLVAMLEETRRKCGPEKLVLFNGIRGDDVVGVGPHEPVAGRHVASHVPGGGEVVNVRPCFFWIVPILACAASLLLGDGERLI